MPTDRYTKTVLTVIAAALIGIFMQNSMKSSQAQGPVQKVEVCNADGSKCAAIATSATVGGLAVSPLPGPH